MSFSLGVPSLSTKAWRHSVSHAPSISSRTHWHASSGVLTARPLHFGKSCTSRTNIVGCCETAGGIGRIRASRRTVQFFRRVARAPLRSLRSIGRACREIGSRWRVGTASTPARSLRFLRSHPPCCGFRAALRLHPCAHHLRHACLEGSMERGGVLIAEVRPLLPACSNLRMRSICGAVDPCAATHFSPSGSRAASRAASVCAHCLIAASGNSSHGS